MPRRARGFTLVELVAVLMLLAVLAVVALPKLDDGLALGSATARDEAVAALRHAQQTALSHRRLVCVEVAATSISLRIARAHGALACDAALAGPAGTGAFTANPGRAGFSLAPAGTLYFQPDGRATRDAAGASPADRTLAVGAAGSPVRVVGETGLVR